MFSRDPDSLLRAIAEPNRREMLRLVWDRERSAGEIAARFDMTFGAVSQHLRVLREAGLVEQERRGRERIYRARKEELGGLGQWLEATWVAHLGRLKVLAEAAEQGEEARE